jgi:hypothetical protein
MKEKLNKYIENLKELSTIEKERNKKLDKKFVTMLFNIE